MAKKAHLAEDAAKKVHLRRLAISRLRDKKVTKKLFDELAEEFVDRSGGYTRIYKLAIPRRGDAADMALIELVLAGDEGYSKKKKRKKAPKESKAPAEEKPAEETAEKANSEEQASEEPLASAEQATESEDAAEEATSGQGRTSRGIRFRRGFRRRRNVRQTRSGRFRRGSRKGFRRNRRDRV